MSKMLIRDRNPINQYFKGSHFHHLHINGNDTIGIYIPEEMHLQNNHANWKHDVDALKRVNNLAFVWLCNQEIINGDHYNPNAPGTYIEVKDSELVNLPKVDEEIRAELNIIKARKKDKSLSDTLQGLIEDSKELSEAKKKIAELEEVKSDLTYEEVEALYSISSAVDDSDDSDFMKNCISGSQKLHGLMEKMKEDKGLK